MPTTTKATTFTPGPWRSADWSHGSTIVGPDNCTLVATIEGLHNRKAEAQANARLIAAAPTLLAWIRRVAYEPIGDAEATAATILETLTTEARAVLAKVEG